MTETTPAGGEHPPLVPLVLRVGVTGHRPDDAKRKDPDVGAIRCALAEVLKTVQLVVDRVAKDRRDLHAPLPDEGARRHVRLISALASGPDQWAAREAVALGYELQCVLPFGRDEYREDFRGRHGNGGEWEEEFVALLGLATAVFELDGRVVRTQDERLPDGHSYRSAGRAILRQSDLLVALWDGQPPRGTGGTGEMVDEALGRGIPVVWIPWGRPEAWHMLLPNRGDRTIPPAPEAQRVDLPRTIESLLLPPDEIDGDAKGAAERREYFREGRKRRPAHGAGTWPGTTALDAGLRAFVDGAFLSHYRWANSLSIHFGHLHRGAFVVTASLGAAAVFLALYSIAAGIEGRGESPWILAELVVILAILGLTRLGRLRRWHQRWIDYRMLAERLRIARCTSLLGGGSPRVAHAGHHARYGNPLRTWMHWHSLAVERAAGLPPRVAVTGEYLAACRDFWSEGLVESQRRYHERAAATFAALDHRLHRAANVLFALTLAACVLHVALLQLDGGAGGAAAWVPPHASGWLTLLCAFLPAAGSASAAIRGFAETHRLVERSRAMHDALGALQADLAALPLEGGALNLQRLQDCTDRVADLMIRETLDWRVVFQDRPLNLPG